MISVAHSSSRYVRSRSSGRMSPDCSSRTMNVPVPVNGSWTWTFRSVSPRPKCSRSTWSAARRMKSTTSTGV